MSSTPTVLTTEKLDAAGMRPISQQEFMEVITAISEVEGENTAALDLSRRDYGSFIYEMRETILNKLGEIERCYRLEYDCEYPWYDQKLGAYLSSVTNTQFNEDFPSRLQEEYEISANYAVFIREILKVCIKKKASELAAIYSKPFIHEDNAEQDLEEEGED